MNMSHRSSTVDLMPRISSSFMRRKILSLRATRRILAPYVKARQKPKIKVQENHYFSYFAQKKPSILMKVMTKWCLAADIMDVLNETASVLKETTLSKEVRVYMVDDNLDEIHQITDYIDYNEHRVSFKIETGTSVAAHVAYTKKLVKVNDLLEDIRFPDGLGNGGIITNKEFCPELTVKAVMCVPVLNPENECLAVFLLYREIDESNYTDRDLRIVSAMCSWIGSANHQNHQRLILQKQQELNEYLLHLTECYFADTKLLDKLISEVVNFAKIVLNAEHGLFYVLKPGNNELCADLYEEEIGTGILYKKSKVKLDPEDLISLIAQKGNIVNIKNGYTDLRVKQNRKNYKIRSLLCMPIKCFDIVLGVMEVVNKKKIPFFKKADEILLQTFSDYCELILKYARLHEKMEKTNSLNNIYKEMLSNHMLPCIHDTLFVLNHPDIPSLPERFHQFDFYMPDAYDAYMPQLIMYMFNTISEDWFVNNETLTKFVLTVQKAYRDLPYHNFRHAFHATHCMYNMLRRNMNFFTEMEIRAMMLATLCHDVDHIGESNNFLIICKNSISELYEESAMEYHHYHITKFIIKFLKIFSYLSASEYKIFMREVKSLILATDISTHFAKRIKLCKLYHDKIFDASNSVHKNLMKSVMMTLVDLSCLFKHFSISKVLTDNRYIEFYNQGDKEKEMGFCPMTVMDRDKDHMIAMDQFMYFNAVVLPCTLIVVKILPNCEPLYRDAVKMRDTWKDISDNQGQKLWTIEDSIPCRRA